jgi:hypothetical protein
MNRPELHPIPLASALQFPPGSFTVTMSPGQWDRLLDSAYRQGCVLLELDASESPVAAHKRCFCDICEAHEQHP